MSHVRPCSDGLLGLKPFTAAHEQEQHPKAGQTASNWAHSGIRNSVGQPRIPKSLNDPGRCQDCETQNSDAQTYSIITFVAFLSILPSVDSAKIVSFRNFPKTADDVGTSGKISPCRRIGSSGNIRRFFFEPRASRKFSVYSGS